MICYSQRLTAIPKLGIFTTPADKLFIHTADFKVGNAE
jgi:hypothetical protein